MSEKIEPIINGKANPRLTLDLFRVLDFEVQRNVVWSQIVDLKFGNDLNYLRGVDHEFFTEHPMSQRVKHGDITPDNVETLFLEAKQAAEAQYQDMLRKTAELHFQLGGEIFRRQSELGFAGRIEMTAHKLRGYVSEIGNWNDFVADEVAAAIWKMHDLAPRTDAGPNNVNAGKIKHKWSVEEDYIFLCYPFIGGGYLPAVQAFFKTYWEPEGSRLKADSTRYIETDAHEGKYFEVVMYWWWD